MGISFIPMIISLGIKPCLLGFITFIILGITSPERIISITPPGPIFLSLINLAL